MAIMDHNRRASMARTSQQPVYQKQRKEDDDAFMLPEKEVAGCISDIGLAFTVDDLRKPNPQQIQRVFEWFAELLTNTTRELVAPAMHAAAVDMHGDDADRIFTADTRDLMGFFIVIRKLLLECGINDFTFSDIYRPTHMRLVKIFSYIINFIRFRESQTSVIDDHFNSSERTKNRIQQLVNSNQEKQERLLELQRGRKSTQQAIEEMEKKNQALVERLRELKRISGDVIAEHTQSKGESARLKKVLEERSTYETEVEEEVGRLQEYAAQSPAELEASVRDLSVKRDRKREENVRLIKRDQALQTSCESFKLLQEKITYLTGLLNDVQSELQGEERVTRDLTKNREQVTNESNNVREVVREEERLQNQRDRWQSRIDQLRRDTKMKETRSKEAMINLQETHQGLSREQRERSEEVEKLKLRIEQIERKMKDLKTQVEREVSKVKGEYQKLESHVQLYITEMESSIGTMTE